MPEECYVVKQVYEDTYQSDVIITGVVKPFESLNRVDSNPIPNHQDPS